MTGFVDIHDPLHTASGSVPQPRRRPEGAASVITMPAAVLARLAAGDRVGHDAEALMSIIEQKT